MKLAVSIYKIYKKSGQVQVNTKSSILKPKHPSRNTCSTQKTLAYLAPTVWNTLLTSLKFSGTLICFERKVKRQFFEEMKNKKQDVINIISAIIIQSFATH